MRQTRRNELTCDSAMNILFITADQWRGDCLSSAGHPCLRTPSLDALANAGVLFTSHYCQATPCGPSRASMHTGLYLMNHRSVTNGTPLDARHRNWAQVMRDAGWKPVLFGYTDTSVDPRDYPPGHPALTTYEGILPGLESRLHVNLGDAAAWTASLADLGYDIPVPSDRIYRVKSEGQEWEDGGTAPLPLAVRAEHHDTHFVTDAAIDYVSTVARDRPWCVHLSLLRPHPPWIAPAPYNAMYSPHALPSFVRAPSRQIEGSNHPWLAAALEVGDMRTPDSEATLRRLQASYYGLISEVDDNLGRLFDALKHTDQWHDTLIIFTSDHGEQMGDHWLFGKAGFFDQSFHVPLIVRDPRAPARHGARVTRFTEHVDLMPTLLDYAALETPTGCNGRSLRPLLESPAVPPDWRAHVNWEYDFRDADALAQRLDLAPDVCVLNVIRDERFKYVHFAGLPPLLFDLINDPGELHNVAGNSAYARVTLAYAQRLLNWRLRHTDRSMTDLRLTRSGVHRASAAGERA